jgi:hypothetical protein
MTTQRLLAFALAGLLLLSLWLTWPFAAFGDAVLFQDAPSGTPDLPVAQQPDVQRGRPVQVNWRALSADTSEIRLNLFDDSVLTAERLRVDYSVLEGFVWVGRVVGVPDSLVSLSVQGDSLAGNVRLHGLERYTIMPDPATSSSAGLHIIKEVDPTQRREPDGVDAIAPPNPMSGDLGDETAALQCEDGSVIDILIAYTTAAAAKLGGPEAMASWISLRLSEMNSANTDSQTPFQWRLAGVMETSYQESGNLETDLTRLQNADDGHLDAVRAARLAKKADLTSLVIAMGNRGACGIAFQMNSASAGFAEHAFGVTALDYEPPYTCSELTLAHELGHNMGNAHDLTSGGAGAVHPYSYGYQDPGAAFRTIMAYDCDGGCPRIGRWSNPRAQHNGLPTGTESVAGENSANVARSMGEVSQMVANFQPNCPVVDPPTPTPTITPVPDATVEPTATPLPTTNAPSPTSTVDPTLTVMPTASPPTATPQPTLPAPTATRALPPTTFRLWFPVIFDFLTR